MSTTERPRVGILSDSPLQRNVIQHAISSYGLEIALSCDPARFDIAQKEELDNIGCWILELENEDDLPDLIDTLLDSTNAGVLFGLGKAPERHSDEYPLEADLKSLLPQQALPTTRQESILVLVPA